MEGDVLCARAGRFPSTVLCVGAMSQFFSCKVTKKGTPTPFVPRPVEMDGAEEVLQLSQACIPASVDLKNGTRVSINIKTADMEEPVALATMVVGQLDTVSLGLILDGMVQSHIQSCTATPSS